MKIAKLIFFQIILLSSSYAQLRIGGTYNFDIYKPYTHETQEYLKINNQVSSSTYNFYTTYKIKQKGKISWQSGLSYKVIEQSTLDKVRSYYDYDSQVGSHYYKEDTLDLHSKSKSLAWKNDVVFIISKKANTQNELGLSNEFYFFERYKSYYTYQNTNDRFESINIDISPLSGGFYRFFASSTNLSLFYSFLWQANEKFSLGTKISLGTNLYSDWDQFSKYAWLGVGLELGFGKKKE